MIFSEMFYEETNKYLTDSGFLEAKDIHKILFTLNRRLLSGELDDKALSLGYPAARFSLVTALRRLLQLLKTICGFEPFSSKQANFRQDLRTISKSKNTAYI